jgi:ATP-dependent helicase/nuclease subunit A
MTAQLLLPLPGQGDADALQRQASDPTASVWVAASAGTGKTKVLTDRVLCLMLSGTVPSRILCLTFTRAAAAEMQQRIADRLSEWATLDRLALEASLLDLLGRRAAAAERLRARQLFAQVLDTPGGLNIQTIHAFCQSLLARFPLEAKLPPHFSVVDERDATDMLREATLQMLQQAGESDGPVADSVAVLVGHLSEDRFHALVTDLTREAGRIDAAVRAHGSEQQLIAAIERRLGASVDETPEMITAAACIDASFDGEALRTAVAALAKGGAKDRKRAQTIARWLQADADKRVALFTGYRDVFVCTQDNLPCLRPCRSLANTETLRILPAAKEILCREGERLVRIEQRCRAAVTVRASAAVVMLAQAVTRAYEAMKRGRALLDYDDLIRATARLLQADGSVSWVLYKLDGGIDHVLIDEAQDTNPEQWQVVQALTDEFFAGATARQQRRTVFAVGDVKQSIFSFQGAEPAEFLANRTRYAARATAAGEMLRRVDLTISFRSTRAVLAAVDAVFARPEAHAGVALDGEPIGHQVSPGRAGDGGVVEVWPEIFARAEEAPPAWKPPVERVDKDAPHTRLARLIAGRIAQMLATDQLASRNRPVEPGDVMILVRRRDAFFEAMVRALKDRRIPVTGADRMVLNQQIAVMDLVALGRFLLLPSDDLTLATVLKSPLVGLDDDDLFRIGYDRDPLSLWQALVRAAESGDDAVAAAAHAYLAGLLAQVDFLPPFEFYARVLGPLGGRRKLFGRLGHEADEPIAEFLDLAMRYDRNHPPTLQGFLHWLDTGAVEVKRDMEQGVRNAVRVMTAHGAKGLQAPIVFLPDTMQVPRLDSGGRPPPVLWDEEVPELPLPLWAPSVAALEPVTRAVRAGRCEEVQEECRRLLYVAMTRAEDRLIVCGWRGRNSAAAGCWYQLIRDGLNAAKDSLGVQTGTDLLLAASTEFDGDPVVLRLVSPQTAQPRSETRSLVAAPDPAPDWVWHPPAAEPAAPRPLIPSRAHDEEDPPVRPPLAAGGRNALRRGRIIHRLLQSLPALDPALREKAAVSWLAAPARELSPAEQAEIAREVLAVITLPEVADLFGPDSLAEVPISGEVRGRLISAQVDRLVVRGDRVSVLDYKTDRPPPADVQQTPPAYLRQMALYRAALRAVFPGARVACLLLWTDGPRLMPLPDRLLDPFES